MKQGLLINLWHTIKQDRPFFIGLLLTILLYAILVFIWYRYSPAEALVMIFISSVFTLNILLSFAVWPKENFAAYLLSYTTIFIEILFLIYFLQPLIVAR